ncbi:MAG: protein translocase SEC61 complex subunit gamma [Candidatus Altiarchaeota archaeon]
MKLGETIRKIYSETKRILMLTRKPKRSEFNEIIKVTGAGIILMGFLGFLILIIARSV